MPNRNERRKRTLSPESYEVWKNNKNLRHGQNTLDRLQMKALDDDLAMAKDCYVMDDKDSPQTIKHFREKEKGIRSSTDMLLLHVHVLCLNVACLVLQHNCYKTCSDLCVCDSASQCSTVKQLARHNTQADLG